MSDSWETTKANCFIEFRVLDKKRFEILKRFFDALQAALSSPNADDGDDSTLASRSTIIADTQETRQVAEETRPRKSTGNFDKPEQWLLSFRPQDLEYLRMPPHADSIKMLREWSALSRRERRRHIKATKADATGDLHILADFADMLKKWNSIEYDLITCEMHESDRARVTYSTYKFPFEGKAALEDMLIFFGFLSFINDSC